MHPEGRRGEPSRGAVPRAGVALDSLSLMLTALSLRHERRARRKMRSSSGAEEPMG